MEATTFLNEIIPDSGAHIIAGGKKVPVDKIAKIEIDIQRKTYKLDFVVSLFNFDRLGISKYIELSKVECDIPCRYCCKQRDYNAILKSSLYVSSKGVHIISVDVDVENCEIGIPDKKVFEGEKEEPVKRFIDLD